MPFERYAGRQRTRGGSDIKSITITKNGYININAAASEFFNEFEYVDLFFDESTNRVALKPTKEKKDGTYSLIKQPNYDAFKVGSKGFLKKFDIPFEETKRFPAEWEESSGMLIAAIQ